MSRFIPSLSVAPIAYETPSRAALGRRHQRKSPPFGGRFQNCRTSKKLLLCNGAFEYSQLECKTIAQLHAPHTVGGRSQLTLPGANHNQRDKDESRHAGYAGWDGIPIHASPYERSRPAEINPIGSTAIVNWLTIPVLWIWTAIVTRATASACAQSQFGRGMVLRCEPDAAID